MTPLDEVNAFIDRLGELPLGEWIAIGRGVIAKAMETGRPETALAIVDATLATEGLSVMAWYARDAVETSAFVASRSDRRWTSAERKAFTAAQTAAVHAAYAILVRQHVPAADFAAVIAPFSSAILLPSPQAL